jgi:thiopeptide-type bacteriocin biosynthesis protein
MSDSRLHAFPFALVRTPLQDLQTAYRITAEIPRIFQEGLYLASPEFWQELQKAGAESVHNEKIKQSLYKYWIRSATRCTPYGTFAGCSLAAISDESTSIVLKNKEEHVRCIRLDMNYMANIISAISRLSPIVEQLRFSLNNSIYQLPGNMRYAEYSIRNNIRHYHLASIQSTTYLTAVLERAAIEGGATIDDLTTVITDIEEVTTDEARAFVLDLWQSQILISELEPAVTGQDPLSRFIDQLSSFNSVGELVRQLKDIQNLMRNPQPGIAYLQDIENRLKMLAFSPEIPKNALQVDLFLATQHCRINRRLADNILAQSSDLLSLARTSVSSDLSIFKKKFYSRYQDAEVPLNIALDSDIGIGYAGITPDISGTGELVEDIQVNKEQHNSQGEDIITRYVFSKYHDYLKYQKTVIEIEEAELKGLATQTGHLSFSESMHIMGDLSGKDGKLDADNFIFYLASLGGTSGGNLLGRFTYGDPAIFQATRQILSREESNHPDVIFAEIAHLPQARVGNILLRPSLREYEIPYIGKSGVSPEKQIAVDDLMVSVKSDEVVLRSRRLNKRIIPRLTTAHNFGFNSLPVYKFLCDLQQQGLAFPNVWDWGFLNTLKYLPRVVYKNIVVKKATWRIDETEVSDLPKTPDQYKSYIGALRNKWNIPERVAYKEGDNELLLDFSEEAGILLFIHYLKRNKAVQLEEFLLNKDSCIATDVDGNPYVTQVIFPIQYQAVASKKQSKSAEINRKKVKDFSEKRKFSIYSEWLFFKVYCGPKMAERLLAGALLRFLDAEKNRGLFEKFFFIRFRDEGGHHLRLRFFNKDLNKQLTLIKELMQILQPLVDDGSIENIALDSYSRELERYGEGLIEHAEQLFYNDSMAVIQFINLLEESGDPERYKLLLSIRGIDMLLSDFGFNIDEKVQLLNQISTGYFSEFGAHLALQRQLNSKYRRYQQSIFSHMDGGQDHKNGIEEAIAVLAIRSDKNAPVVEEMMTKLSPFQKQELFKLLPSYIHMFINRLFITDQRKYELVICHFLDRYYHSVVAIMKKGRSTVSQ